MWRGYGIPLKYAFLIVIHLYPIFSLSATIEPSQSCPDSYHEHSFSTASWIDCTVLIDICVPLLPLNYHNQLKESVSIATLKWGWIPGGVVIRVVYVLCILLQRLKRYYQGLLSSKTEIIMYRCPSGWFTYYHQSICIMARSWWSSLSAAFGR